MINEHGWAVICAKAWAFVAGRVLPTMLIALLVLPGSTIGRPSQQQIMEYYIYYRGSLASYYGERYDHAFATFEEAERARQKAAIDTRGDAENFLANTYIKEVPTGRYTNPAPEADAPAVKTPGTRTPVRPGPTTPARRGPEAGETDHRDILKRLKEPPLDLDKTTLLELLKGGGSTVGDEIATARAELETMEPVTMANEKELIAQRQIEPNPWCDSLRRSLKTKAPPLPDKMFSQLQPGDVLLIAPEDTLTLDAWVGHYIRLFDKLSSWEWGSRASHTCIYLREVKGVRFFLDNLPGEGPRIKTEDEIAREYGGRAIDVAQPVSRLDGDVLWSAARDLGIRQITAELNKAGNLIDTTDYGLYGHDNMVCSEASRFALIKAGLEIADTDSLLKKLLGIYFGPANFYSDEQHFLITPLERLPKDKGKS